MFFKKIVGMDCLFKILSAENILVSSLNRFPAKDSLNSNSNSNSVSTLLFLPYSPIKGIVLSHITYSKRIGVATN